MHQGYFVTPTWTHDLPTQTTTSSTWRRSLKAFSTGLLFPLGFAPFHLPGLAILSLALLFIQLIEKTPKAGFLIGFMFGTAVFGLGASWVYNSIHTYGHLNVVLSGLITLIFVAFFSLYTAFFALSYTAINKPLPLYLSPFLFSSLWVLSEYLRATLFTGFPWLMLGTGQIDSPLKSLLPLIGILGVSGVTALLSGLLGLAFYHKTPKKRLWLCVFVGLLMLPESLHHKTWTTLHHEPISVGIIQADLSMRDKWDHALYQKIQTYYENTTKALLPQKDLVIMPESAIPLPSTYATPFLKVLNQSAINHHSAVLLGIPHPSHTLGYHNALLGLGHAKGTYAKQHLVPFGEYLPKAFRPITNWLNLPNPNIIPGNNSQPPVTFNQHTIASLICYELAYPELLRKQLPAASFIVSISDDGWFGHSLAVYQQLQMAQVLSQQTGRFQIVSNNDGLSSLIDANGNILQNLPAFSKGILEGNIYSATGETPWVSYGDKPIFLLHLLFVLLLLGLRVMLAAKPKRSYPNQPN
ncbi:MAG: apolipoprotein N-acyltransferase [Legionellaceae bacterium]|nr:apolipoprotein N-acyltransferase [Legionellaceae bacterium]